MENVCMTNKKQCEERKRYPVLSYANNMNKVNYIDNKRNMCTTFVH